MPNIRYRSHISYRRSEWMTERSARDRQAHLHCLHLLKLQQICTEEMHTSASTENKNLPFIKCTQSTAKQLLHSTILISLKEQYFKPNQTYPKLQSNHWAIKGKMRLEHACHREGSVLSRTSLESPLSSDTLLALFGCSAWNLLLSWVELSLHRDVCYGRKL